VSGVDLFPTICDYAGVEAPADLHGYSLRPLLENKGSWPRQDVLAQFNQHIMLRTKEWKLNVYDGELGELYRLSDDPKEHYNLIGNPEYAGVAEQLHQRMQELLSMK
jgi:choline-sulfatase